MYHQSSDVVCRDKPTSGLSSGNTVTKLYSYYATETLPKLKKTAKKQSPPMNSSANSGAASSTPALPITTGSSEAGSSQSNSQEKPKTTVAAPEQVMLLYMSKLTPYEHHEIFSYPQIYFIGANAKKRAGRPGVSLSEFDNEQGSYIHIPHDHVAYRYEVLKVIGKGSFGQVVKAYDHKTHEHVALKMVRNEKRFHRQAQEEIRILQHLRKQDKDNTMNIIHMFDFFTFRNHMCITFELLSINLYELIKKNKFQGFSLQLVRKFSHSLLQCLDALHNNKIIHCDMKPENVLLKQQGRSGIKVIDFGSSCYEHQRIGDGTTVLNGGLSRRGKPRGPPGSKDLKKALKGCNDQLFLDFISRCLEWDPEKRMTPSAALRHAWLRRRLPRPPNDKCYECAKLPSSTIITTTSSSSATKTSAVVNKASIPSATYTNSKLRGQVSSSSDERSRHNLNNSNNKLPNIQGVQGS
ncbi:dual specificity tyrosine-phosphorylation-regulated kinase 2-like [Ctenocephalides felis]|uniref:dual specificity tyrosine-phosphorylation-regulated kinase 2-like n=1 Tax=Ctenocephalides felis TaxID=7515 RepID=UPI000E6E13CF|nr:dual specificity tyrosine-phosphorylation-regulated kinase 2-like [Ctenocephalides felis]